MPENHLKFVRFGRWCTVAQLHPVQIIWGWWPCFNELQNRGRARYLCASVNDFKYPAPRFKWGKSFSMLLARRHSSSQRLSSNEAVRSKLEEFTWLKKACVAGRKLCGYTRMGGCIKVSSDIEAFTQANTSLAFPSERNLRGTRSSKSRPTPAPGIPQGHVWKDNHWWTVEQQIFKHYNYINHHKNVFLYFAPPSRVMKVKLCGTAYVSSPSESPFRAL